MLIRDTHQALELGKHRCELHTSSSAQTLKSAILHISQYSSFILHSFSRTETEKALKEVSSSPPVSAHA